jgi:hypothetical protein
VCQHFTAQKFKHANLRKTFHEKFVIVGRSCLRELDTFFGIHGFFQSASFAKRFDVACT